MGGEIRDAGATSGSDEDAPGLVEFGAERPGIGMREAGEDYDVVRAIAEMEREMAEAAEAMEFERAALLRDQIYELKKAENPFKGTVQEKKRKTVAYHPGKGRPGGWRKKK